jgi:TM2 domain-containing membrane protein YozV
MTLTDLDYRKESWIEYDPPECVLTANLAEYLPSISEFKHSVLALTVEKGGKNGPPIGRLWVFYLYRNDIDRQQPPDEVLTFNVDYANMNKIYHVDNYLGGFLFGSQNAPPLNEAQGWDANKDPRNKAAGEELLKKFSGQANRTAQPGGKLQETSPSNQHASAQGDRKIIAGILGILLGGLGIHRFYLGYTTIGIIQIVVTLVTLGWGALWGLVEGILILTGNVITQDANGNPL